jgi:TolB protein
LPSFRNSRSLLAVQRSIAALIATLAITSNAPAQDQDVMLEIRQRTGAAIKLALPNFVAGSTAAQYARLMHEVVTQDLEYSMVFDLVDSRVYPSSAPGEPIPWDSWRSTGARALVHGEVSMEGTTLVVEFRLFDVATGRQVDGKRYRNALAGHTDESVNYMVRQVAHLFNDDAVLHYTGVRGVAATQVAFVSTREAPAGTPQKELFVMSYDGARQRRITYNRSIALSPSFSPQGDRIAYQTYVLHNGFPRAEIHMILKSGGKPTMLLGCDGTNNGPAFSPDGTQIAVSSSCSGNSEIWLLSDNGSRRRQITYNRGSDVSPAWSPNADQIVFVSDRSGSQQLYIMDATGLNTRRLSTPGGQKDDPAWQTVRGDLIAFTASTGGNNFDIFVYDLHSDRVHQLTRGRGRKEAPSWSPDGRQLVFEWAQGSSVQIWMMGFDGSHQRMLTSLGSNVTPAWGNRP